MKTKVSGLINRIWRKFSDSNKSIRYIEKTGATSWLPGYKYQKVMNGLKKAAKLILLKNSLENNFLIKNPINNAKKIFEIQIR